METREKKIMNFSFSDYFFPTMAGVILFILTLTCSGCSTVANRPATDMPEFKTPADIQKTRVAVQIDYANGTHVVHLKRAEAITNKLVSSLNALNGQRLSFFCIDHFDSYKKYDYDYLLQVSCSKPEHISKVNKALLLLGWPATLSIVASPLGLVALSLPGIEKESTEFNWHLSLVPKHYETSLCLKKKDLPGILAKVSGSGWGIPEEKLEQAYRNTESHLIAEVIKFLNPIKWEQMDSRVRQYARTHLKDEQVSDFAAKTVASHQPAANGSDMALSPLGKRYAVIIGISKYKYASDKHGLSNLRYADDDALGVNDILRQKGWRKDNIKLLINEQATKRNISIAFESWLTKTNKNDIIVMYWAGHAFPDPADPEKIYFACHDTDIKIPATGLRMDRVRDFLEERRARNIIILADTCHAGKMITRGGRGVTIQPYLKKMKQTSDIPKGW